MNGASVAYRDEIFADYKAKLKQPYHTLTGKVVALLVWRLGTTVSMSMSIVDLAHNSNRGDLGFYKGGCPIRLKGATEVERRRQGRGQSIMFGGLEPRAWRAREREPITEVWGRSP